MTGGFRAQGRAGGSGTVGRTIRLGEIRRAMAPFIAPVAKRRARFCRPTAALHRVLDIAAVTACSVWRSRCARRRRG